METFNCITDTELRKRRQAYPVLHEMLGFMADFTSLSVNELRARVGNPVVAYSSDLEESCVDEFVHLTFLTCQRQTKVYFT